MDDFVACGGNRDLTGHVQRSRLVQIIKEDFGLSIDIEELISKVDADDSGEIVRPLVCELHSSALRALYVFRPLPLFSPGVF